MALGLTFGVCIILIYQKMKLQSKNYEILNKQKLRKKIYIYLPLTCFLFRNSLTTICFLFRNSSTTMFDSFVFLPLSTRAYFKGRAYIKIILKNHARSYFAGRSYYRGNTVVTTFYKHTIWISNCIRLDWHFTAQAIPSRVVSRVGFWPGSGLKLTKISGLIRA